MNIAYVPKSSVPTRLSLGWTIIEGAPHLASWAVLMQIPEIEVDTPVPFIPARPWQHEKPRRTVAEQGSLCGGRMMGQNTSTAVMQHRVEAHDSLDDFPTPPWATRALMKHVIAPAYGSVSDQSCWEPACNRGHMARPLAEFFREVIASDVHDYGTGHVIRDFLFPGDVRNVDWIITNPPFRLAQQFIERSSEIATTGFAMIVRSAFLEGVGRYNELFLRNPPSIIAQFTERVVMVKGRLDGTGSTATAYCWLVWIDGETDTRFQWIPPCRKQLERATDYAGAEH